MASAERAGIGTGRDKMNCESAELSPSLPRASTWLVIVVVAFFVFRNPLSDLVGVLGRNVRKLSFGGLSR